MTEEKYARSLAVQYKCWECTAKYYDGKNDCEMTRCPLYPFMPYAREKPIQEYLAFSPRHKGNTPIEETKRELTEEQRVLLGDRMKMSRSKKKEE